MQKIIEYIIWTHQSVATLYNKSVNSNLEVELWGTFGYTKLKAWWKDDWYAVGVPFLIEQTVYSSE